MRSRERRQHSTRGHFAKDRGRRVALAVGAGSEHALTEGDRLDPVATRVHVARRSLEQPRGVDEGVAASGLTSTLQCGACVEHRRPETTLRRGRGHASLARADPQHQQRKIVERTPERQLFDMPLAI
jgi:hypothetical protein